MITIRREGRGWDLYPTVRFHWDTAATEWADEVGPLFRDTLKRHCPVNTRPHFTNHGRMRESITSRRATSGGASVWVDFEAHTSYARYVLKGTTEHTIRPVAAKALHWYDRPVFGQEYFSGGVLHPGQRPNHFPDRALQEDKDEISRSFIKIIEDHLHRALEG